MSYEPPPGPQPYGPPPGYPVQPAPKKSKKTLWIVLGSVLAGVLLLCGGGAVIAVLAGGYSAGKDKVAVVDPSAGDAPAEPEQAKEPAEFNLKPGTTVTITGDEGTQQVTIKSVKPFKKGCGEFNTDPEKGVYIVADVQVAVTKGKASVNSLFFKWVGADGTTSDSLSGLFSGCEKTSLDSVNDLRAGQKRVGQMTFDVTSAKGAIEFAPSAFSDAMASWKVG